MEDHQKTLLKQVFGDSSDSEEEEEDEDSNVTSSRNDDGSHSIPGRSPTWEEPVEEIRGLWLCRDFLSPHQQTSLLLAVHKEGWFTEASNNQAMRFGDLPSWAVSLSSSIREVVLFGDCGYDCEPADLVGCERDGGPCPLPSNIVGREPFFDQLIVNVYQPGEGICAHVDLMRFEDGIAIVSLESPCVMHFSRAGETCDRGEGGSDQAIRRFPVLLAPGSLVLMSGEARYLWKHEINRKVGFQVWEGQELNQSRRTSITLRKLCHVE